MIAQQTLKIASMKLSFLCRPYSRSITAFPAGHILIRWAYINAELKKPGAEEKITVIDIYPHFLDTDKRLDKKYTYDGLHLDLEGCHKWASILRPYLK